MGTDINIYDNCKASEIRCNTMTSSFRGINFLVAMMVGGNSYGNSNDATDNSWEGEYLNNTNVRIDGAFASLVPIDWWHQGNFDPLNSYCPYYYNPTAITPVSGATSQGCPLVIFNNDYAKLQQNIKDAALNNIQYVEYTPENLFNDDKTSFETAKDDTTLLEMFGGLQTVINQWYTAQRQGNIGKFKDVKDYIAAKNKQAAQIAAMSIVDNTVILQNQKLATQIYLDHFFDKNSTPLDDVSKEQLEEIAYQTTVQGGEGVYFARAMLGIDVHDLLPLGLRSVQNVILPSVNQFKCTISPNPAMNGCLISFDTGVDIIEVIDLVGKQNYIYKVDPNQQQFMLDLNQYNPGMYALKLLKNTQVLFREKLVVIK